MAGLQTKSTRLEPLYVPVSGKDTFFSHKATVHSGGETGTGNCQGDLTKYWWMGGRESDL